jgi:peroxiredoxin
MLMATKIMHMRCIFSTAFFLIASLSFAQSSSPTQTDPLDSLFRVQFPKVYAEIGHPFPAFELKSENKTINNKSLTDKVVLINFWFEGCLPCMAEMEALNELFEKLKNNKDFVFISLTRDNQEAAERVKKKYGLTFDIFSATAKECSRLNFGSGYPTSIVLDKTGIIKFIHVGGATDKDWASERVLTILLPEIQSLL